MQEVGERIRDVRTSKNLTKKEFGDMLSVAEKTIYNYETGKSPVTLEFLYKVSSVFNIDYDYLVHKPESISQSLESISQEYLPFNQKNVPQMSPNMSISDSPTSADMIAVPFFKDNTASAGFGVMNFGTEVAHIPLSKPFLLEVCGVASLKGLSMLKCSGE